MIRQTYLEVTTIANGSGTHQESIIPANSVGFLYAVQWIKGSLSNTVDVVLSNVHDYATRPILTLTNASANTLYYPRDNSHDLAGNSLADNSQYPMIDGDLLLAVAQGGDTKTGGCIVFWMDEEE